MRRIITVAVIGLMAVSLSGCKFKKAIDAVNVSKDLEKRGTMDIMEKAAKDQYAPPADGRLTDAQVQMYLKVREKEKQILEVAKKEMQQHADSAKKEEAEKDSLSAAMATIKTMGSAADVVTADIRAAIDLGYNTAEYQWVKGQVLAASSAAVTEKMNQATAQMADTAYAQMKQQYESATDPNMKKMYGDMLKQYDEQRAQTAVPTEGADPAVAFNRELLAKHNVELNAIAQEWAKWEGKPGELQKNMEQGMQQLQQAADQMQQQSQQYGSK